ncbi:hypothetical protein R3I94_022621 [Phoxinus phoxinus]
MNTHTLSQRRETGFIQHGCVAIQWMMDVLHY